ncbi:MAG: hypothetical protein ABI488_18245 [Polyangiaceae bacterium]
MKFFRAGVSAIGVISIASSLVACSSDNQGPVQTAGAPAVGGATGAGGTPSTSAGAPAGGASPEAGASSAGSQSGGASSEAGATSAGAGTSGSGAAGGLSNSGGSSGSGGSAGSAAGAAGAAGGSARPEAELDGAGWTMKCNKADTDPTAQDRCYLLPPGATTCPSAGYTSVDQTLHFGGTPGTHYQVTIHFQGTHEAGDYTGGTANPKEFLRSATHVTGGLHTWLSMDVSSPAATYNPNSGGGAGSVQVYDYSATIPVDAGATIRLKAFDSDCLMHRYCQNMDVKNCKGLVQPPISPADAPIDGSFLQMTVTSVVAK